MATRSRSSRATPFIVLRYYYYPRRKRIKIENNLLVESIKPSIELVCRLLQHQNKNESSFIQTIAKHTEQEKTDNSSPFQPALKKKLMDFFREFPENEVSPLANIQESGSLVKPSRWIAGGLKGWEIAGKSGTVKPTYFAPKFLRTKANTLASSVGNNSVQHKIDTPAKLDVENNKTSIFVNDNEPAGYYD